MLPSMYVFLMSKYRAVVSIESSGLQDLSPGALESSSMITRLTFVAK